MKLFRVLVDVPGKDFSEVDGIDRVGRTHSDITAAIGGSPREQSDQPTKRSPANAGFERLEKFDLPRRIGFCVDDWQAK
jgi:hypothetical protein